ncbi:unnamed protein product [Moneuplotes crassus]|uniref:Jacalin-type lectin domain-containing protein n=1 Tax=Euplotes crassus TaxID=5936 RepID=A0AAD1U8Z2_EUPCR|nr:unnamed protein product [Moneuplotes crassus]
MESETEFFDIGSRGNVHDDTVEFDDIELVEDNQNVRLIRIRVWYDDFVYGIQTVYETSNNGILVSPKRLGAQAETWNLKYEEVYFNRNESVVAIKGSHGEIIDHVIFVTSQGREIRFGLSDGGDPFDLEIPEGVCVGALKGGFGGHLHNIGCYTIPLAQPFQYQYSYNAKQRVEKQISTGQTHEDTKEYNDVEFLENTKGQHRIGSIKVFYDDEFVHGLEVKYLENGKEIQTKGIGHEWNKEDHKAKKIMLASDEWITNIYGYFGDICDLLVFETTKGRIEKFGNLEKEPNFNFEIPEGEVVSGISFGIGGHLHNLTAYYGKEPHIFKFDNQPQANVQYSMLQSSTDVVGPTHKDTTAFDDWDKLDTSNLTTRLKKVTIFYDKDKIIYGFKLKWNANEEEVEGEKHIGSEYSGLFVHGDKDSFKLKYDQYITKVYGKVENQVRKLGFELNTGEIYEYGGDEGEYFELGVPHGCGVGALTGGKNGHLHNIQAWYGKIHTATQSITQVYYFPTEKRWPNESMFGNTHKDTTVFRDEGIDFNAHTYRIDTVKVYHTNRVKGIQIIYEIDGTYHYGTKHQASFDYNEEEMQTTMINLEVDEFIIGISGKLTKIITNLTFKTSKGREISCGGDEGDDFQLGVPPGDCIGIIEGGKNGDIHNIKIFTGPMPQVMTTRW